MFWSNYKATFTNILLEDRKILTLSILHQRLTSGKFDIFEGLDDKPHISWSIETLRVFMKRNGFVYSRLRSHCAYTKEREGIVKMRDYYLEWIKKYRASGYRIFWQHETWVFKNMAQNKLWQTAGTHSVDDIDY